MHSLWQRVLEDMSLEQVNHFERPGVLPIAFSLLHYVQGEDRNVSSMILERPTLWEQEGWAERVGATVPQVGRGTPMEVAETLRFGDLDAWRAYQSAVFARTEALLTELTDDDYQKPLFGGAIPERLQGSSIIRIAEPGGPIRVVDVLETFVYNHGTRHIGEIEHARALVGLGGLT